MYDWRKMTDAEREAVLDLRKRNHLPWHSPPHRDLEGERRYLVSATCYEHASIIGHGPERMAECEETVLSVCREFCPEVFAWCVLPNHYHVLLRTERIKGLRLALGEFHGRSSRAWNKADGRVGRKVWHNCFERPMKSLRHFYASLNYVHHNPVKHGYVRRWQDWPFSSAPEFLKEMGRERAEEMWREYPILKYGEKWDV